jgi:uroporphyrinogen-III synthase
MSRPLEGRTAALAEGRQLEELAALLEAEGARVLRCPMVSILDAPEEGPVLAWIDDLIADRFGLVVLMTGEAVRRLLGFAERSGRRAAFLEGLGRVRTLARGPKPVQVLRPLGLSASKVAPAPTTDGVIAALRQENLAGVTVGVTLYGEPNPTLESFLTSAGAVARPVLSYVYAPAADEERIADLIARLQRGEVDTFIFTSTPQAERLFEVAARRGLEAALSEGLSRTRVAAVGPVVADALRRRGAPVHVCPEQGFVMKNLVLYIKRDLAGG